jgi:hypothetical protein
VNGGNFTISTNKSLKFGFGISKDGWIIYFFKNDEVQKLSFSNEKEALEYFNTLRRDSSRVLYHSGIAEKQNGDDEKLINELKYQASLDNQSFLE